MASLNMLMLNFDTPQQKVNSPKRSNGQTPLTLSPYRRITWPCDEQHFVEFYPGESIPVRLTSVRSPRFESLLLAFDDGGPFAFDLEWRPDRGGRWNHFSLIQLATSKGALVVRCPPKDPPSAVLRAFLASHKFYGKSNSQDFRKLIARFGDDFPISNFIDIEKQILLPHDIPVGFEKMLEHLGLVPCARTKDHRVTMSNWEAERLTAEQVLYAAFDAIALVKVVATFPGALDQPVKEESEQAIWALRLPKDLEETEFDCSHFGSF
jgi:hypothetical protein